MFLVEREEGDGRLGWDTTIGRDNNQKERGTEEKEKGKKGTGRTNSLRAFDFSPQPSATGAPDLIISSLALVPIRSACLSKMLIPDE